ncbi:DUF3995 domain-containing protein [Brevibacillus laterosporus]|nr:DUF3995 domain-containing protein [Brevibacillus laterosporus]TPG71553.1 DUF3995 domain-containing protein [Brevibacillus laterosporus]
MDVLIGLSILLLVFIGCIHVYWAFGGKWGVGVAVPTGVSQQPTFVPGSAGTLIVALLLFGASLLLMIQGDILQSIPSYPIVKWGCWVCVAVFGLRSIGEFKYVGLFKRVKSSRFSKYDTYLFTPLCLWLCVVYLYAIIR